MHLLRLLMTGPPFLTPRSTSRNCVKRLCRGRAPSPANRSNGSGRNTLATTTPPIARSYNEKAELMPRSGPRGLPIAPRLPERFAGPLISLKCDVRRLGPCPPMGITRPTCGRIALKMVEANSHPKWCRQAGMEIPVCLSARRPARASLARPGAGRRAFSCASKVCRD